MSELAGANIGPESHVSLSLTDDKKLRVEIKTAGVDGSAGAYAEVSPRALLEKLKALIPGQVDDTLIAAAELALGL